MTVTEQETLTARIDKKALPKPFRSIREFKDQNKKEIAWKKVAESSTGILNNTRS